jgi:acetyl-CoA carboxylase biotin carboxyl carrier protein
LDLKDIRALIDLMKKNDLSVFKMENEGFKITLKKGGDYQPVVSVSAPVAAPVSVPTAPAPVVESKPVGKEIVSPMVGTFYRSPAPDAPAFVEVGDEVTEDTVVCIIEAMKVMNEIKAECRGKVLEIAAVGGKPVQFGQALFRIQ